MQKTIKISDIIVPQSLLDSKPNQYKIDNAMEYFNKHQELDKPVVLDGNVLIDNYVRYLVAVEKGLTELPFVSAWEYKKKNPESNILLSYITGIFEKDENKKEYYWKNLYNLPIKVGDRVLVYSHNKYTEEDKSEVIVTNIFKSGKKHLLKHKPVIKIIESIEEDGK